MDMGQSEREPEDQPVDPDLAWTHWALASLAELVDIQLRTARMTAAEQSATPILRAKPDFALAQARLARSVRLSIAMSQRVRETYQDRKAGKAAAPKGTPAEDSAAKEVAPAEAAPAAGPKDGEPRTEPRESLTDSECLGDELEPGEEAEERRDLDAALLPRDRDGDAAEAPDRLPPEPLADDSAEADPEAARPAEGWRRFLNDSVTGRLVPHLPKPDSS